VWPEPVGVLGNLVVAENQADGGGPPGGAQLPDWLCWLGRQGDGLVGHDNVAELDVERLDFGQGRGLARRSGPRRWRELRR
jgi:hypothetical protein